jgi:hypothetical protein
VAYLKAEDPTKPRRSRPIGSADVHFPRSFFRARTCKIGAGAYTSEVNEVGPGPTSAQPERKRLFAG